MAMTFGGDVELGNLRIRHGQHIYSSEIGDSIISQSSSSWRRQSCRRVALEAFNPILQGLEGGGEGGYFGLERGDALGC
jgi:hypothetical protein